MIRNLSGSTGQIAEEAAKRTEAKQTSFHSLARVMLDNRAASDLCWPDGGRLCYGEEFLLHLPPEQLRLA